MTEVLLVEPDYYTRFPPLALLKLSSHHKSKGRKVTLVRGTREDVTIHPGIIEVTSLFTYAWKPVHKAIEHYHKKYPDAKMRVGGIYASLMKDRIQEKYPFAVVHKGLYARAENHMPDYGLLDDTERWRNWDTSIVFTSRGCIRRCPFCVVPKIEGRFRSVLNGFSHAIYPGHRHASIWDNNFLASPDWMKMLTEMSRAGISIDFNQGLDARLIDESKANMLASLDLSTVRMAYDIPQQKDAITKAVDLLSEGGVRKRDMMFYVLYNFHDGARDCVDTPEYFMERIRYIANLGCVSYPMRYEPPTSLEKNQFVSPFWTEGKLEMVADARRVIGYGGAFPPHIGLVKKFNDSNSFEECFALRPVSS